MKFKRSMIIIILAVFLFSIASAGASDTNDASIASTDDSSLELSESDEIGMADEIQKVGKTDSNEIIGETDEGTFAALDNKISTGTGSLIKLENNYTYEGSGYSNGITISRADITIDGQGHSIDGKGQTRIFNIQSANVVLKNITFLNGKSAAMGGAVYFQTIGEVINCNFISNQATAGGAIFSLNPLYVTVDTCIFKTGSDTTFNTLILPPTLDVDNFTTFYKSDAKLTFDLETARGVSVSDGIISISVYNKTNGELIGNYSCLSGNGWTVNLPVGQYYAVYNTEYAEFKPVNRTVRVLPNTTFWALNYIINGNEDSVIDLTNDFCFDSDCDGDFAGGIEVNRPVTINGNGISIDAQRQARIFNIQAENVVLKNITFQNGNAKIMGGAVRFTKNGEAANCNFINNTAEMFGGAISFEENGTVTDCNFINNRETDANGGAVYFDTDGTVTNSNFTNNGAAYDGGAVYIGNEGSVENCIFTGNTADDGGAVYFEHYGIVTNCKFTGNTADDGGAAYFYTDGNLINCNFADNTAASAGGAVLIMETGNVENCKFTGNNATSGSAIYFEDDSSTKTVSDSIFLNNRADADSLEATVNENNIEICFIGQNNIINAIYSEGDVDLNNVTCWGADGIANITATLSGSDREAGQAVTVTCTVGGNTVTTTYITDENGMIVLKDITGDYLITACHDADSYYTEAETVLTNRAYYINVIPMTTHNLTVNITAKSNEYSEFMGKLMFILPDGDKIEGTYTNNGTWWAVHTFDDYGVYQINASYTKLSDVTVTNAEITVTKAESTLTVSDVAFDYKSSGYTDVSFTGADGVTAKVIDHPEAAVDVKDNRITVSGLGAGTYTLSVTTSPDADHSAVTKTVKVTVNKLKTELTAKAVTATYQVGKNLVITLKDAKGNPLIGAKVTVKIKTSKTIKTDKNGQVTVSTKDLVPAKYTAEITFNGDGNYLKSTKKVTVTVKKAAPKITAAKKTYKATTKTKKYTVTLKDNKGKAIKDAKLTLKVNGKKYTAKTSAKGKATFKITKLTKKGTYTAVITYKGNKYYTETSKKSKIKI